MDMRNKTSRKNTASLTSTAFLAASILLMFSPLTMAQYGAVTTATAGSGRAALELSDSPVLNPASVPFLKGYSFYSGYATQGFAADLATDENPGTQQMFQVGLTDNMKETVFPTSFAYSQVRQRQGDTVDWTNKEFRLSFGQFLFPQLAVGASGQFIQDDIASPELFEPTTKYHQINGSFGILWAPNKGFGIAYVLDRPYRSGLSFPELYRPITRSSLAVNINLRDFVRMKLDVLTDSKHSLHRPTVAGGIETFMNQWMVLRMGAQRNFELAYPVYAAGIGFVGPKFALNYAFLNAPEKSLLTRHAIDLSVPIW